MQSITNGCIEGVKQKTASFLLLLYLGQAQHRCEIVHAYFLFLTISFYCGNKTLSIM